MIQHVTYLYQFNLQFAQTLVKDLSPEQMVGQPNGVVNHPAWSLGHLTVSADHLGTFLGLGSGLAEGWDKPFATGGTHPVTSLPTPPKTSCLLRSRHSTNGTPKLSAALTSHDSRSHIRTRAPGSTFRRSAIWWCS